jgi:putative transposase
MGTVGDAYDNAMAESFFATLQTELLDRQRWRTREQLAQAIFDFVESLYNPTRRHTSLDMRSPNDFEHQHTTSAAVTAA